MKILKLREHKNLSEQAAVWFSAKWGISADIYKESILKCNGANAVPQWYVAYQDGVIIGGLGVIENDFHSRTDLTPNVCAVYVDEQHRSKGIAGQLLKFVCNDMAEFGIDTLYLVTDHTAFYERYGWQFLCEVQCENERQKSRMYFIKTKN